MFENQPPLGTPEGDKFEVLSLLIDEYEKELYSIAAADPIETLKFRMVQTRLTVTDI